MKQASRMVGASAISAAMLIGLCTPSARAAFVVDLTQEGSNVVATGSGSIDLTDLSFVGSEIAGIAMNPSVGGIILGPTGGAEQDVYTGFTGPTNFGPGSDTHASSGSGDVAAIGSGILGVPMGYVSGNALSDSITFNSATFASLGVTPGTYEWTWGDGANQNFTLQIGPAPPVPEPSTWAMLLIGFGLLGLLGYRKRGGALA
jgi:PEP-CTERM motif